MKSCNVKIDLFKGDNFMKNKLFVLLPILLVGLVGCGNKGSGGSKNKATEIQFPEFAELATEADQKDNPNQYVKAYGYIFNDDDEHFDFALDDWFVLSEGNLNYSEDITPIYRSEYVSFVASMIAIEVEDDDLCTYYKLSNGGLKYQFNYVDGIESYEFDKYGRIVKAYTEYREPEQEDDPRSRRIDYYLEKTFNLTFTWGKILPAERDCYYIGLDADWGVFDDNEFVKILKFPSNTQEAYINVLNANVPFYAGGYVSGWSTRPESFHDDYQIISQSLVYDVHYEDNPQFGVFAFEDTAKEITVEFTVTEGRPWVQMVYGGNFYQEEVYLNEEPKVSKKVTLKAQDNYQEPRVLVKQGYLVLYVWGEITSIAFADQNGLYHQNNVSLLAAEFNSDVVGTVPSYAFNGCSKLQRVSLPDERLYYISSYAFYNCGSDALRIFLSNTLALDDNALNGCVATIVYEFDRVPNNTEDEGYESWRTIPYFWGEDFASGFQGHFAYSVWADFVCEMKREYEVFFCFYWERNLDYIDISSSDLLYNTEVTIYDEHFGVMQNLITRENGSQQSGRFSLEANQYYYIGMKNYGQDIYDISVTFEFEA